MQPERKEKQQDAKGISFKAIFNANLANLVNCKSLSDFKLNL